MNTPIAFWFSTPNIWLLEMVAKAGFKHIVLDVEHGLFDLKNADHFILTAKLYDITVHAKTLAPEMGPIQQMLDIGADSVIIPHINDYNHAKEVCAYAKYPPIGKRSAAGGRTLEYRTDKDGHYETQNKHVKCYPMIETEGALRDIDEILSLETVDGIFIGPTDLALSRGRGKYRFADDDQTDIMKIVEASTKSGKRWLMPAWRKEEQELSIKNNAYCMVIEEEQGIMINGLDLCLDNFNKLVK